MKFRRYRPRIGQLNNLSQWSRSCRTMPRSHVPVASPVEPRVCGWGTAHRSHLVNL